VAEHLLHRLDVRPFPNEEARQAVTQVVEPEADLFAFLEHTHFHRSWTEMIFRKISMRARCRYSLDLRLTILGNACHPRLFTEDLHRSSNMAHRQGIGATLLDQVARFWKGFRTFRDLALVALMLQNGLRSCEVLQLQLEDLLLSEARLHVLGKGRKQRFLPLTANTLQVLQNYLHLERPLTNSSTLFVSLKGRRRGQPMTPAGLRSLFRHHRLVSKVPQANPHRFRHTFGSDMVRAGISLPALMHLMGHADIHTTMLYVQLAPEDVWREFARAVQQRLPLSPPEQMS